MPKKGCCRECKYADWDVDGCICMCMIDGFFVCNASEYTCDQYRPAKPMTNADRIRQMTDEELTEMLLLSTCYFGCNKCKYHGKCKGKSCTEAALEWLKQEVSEDAGTD